MCCYSTSLSGVREKVIVLIFAILLGGLAEDLFPLFLAGDNIYITERAFKK